MTGEPVLVIPHQQGGLLVDYRRRNLRPQEAALLVYLAGHKGRLCRQEACAALLWGDSWPADWRPLLFHLMRRLRLALRDSPAWIETVWRRRLFLQAQGWMLKGNIEIRRFVEEPPSPPGDLP